jgi:hypothetical protein
MATGLLDDELWRLIERPKELGYGRLAREGNS